MVKFLSELWKIVNKYLGDIWTITISTWYFIRVEDMSKLNQLIITIYLLFLFCHAYRKRYPKTKKHKVTKVAETVVKRNNTVRFLVTEEGLEQTAESGLNLYDKIRKDGFKDMKKIITLVVKNIWANKVTSGGVAFIIYFYYILVEELFNTNHIVNFIAFTSQNNAFYKWFIIYTLGLILGLMASNGKGLETFAQWVARINYKSLVKKVVFLEGVTTIEIVNTTRIEKIINIATKLLRFSIKVGAINEKEYKEFYYIIDSAQKFIDEYNARKIVERRKREDEAIAKYEANVNERNNK